MGIATTHIPILGLRGVRRTEPGAHLSFDVPSEADLPARLDAYVERRLRGHAAKIRPRHVRSIMAKLEARRLDLSKKAACSRDAGDAERIQGKLVVLDSQIEKARRLFDWVSSKSAR